MDDVAAQAGRVVVVATDPGLRDAARRLAAELGLPMGGDGPAGAISGDTSGNTSGGASGGSSGVEMELRVEADGLSLAWVGDDPDAPGQKISPVRAELTAIDGTSGRGRSLSQPIARAVGLRRGEPWRPTVFDATAGFGEDAFLLAQLGCTVTACERSVVMAALLADAVRRAGIVMPEAAARLSVRLGDAAAMLADPQLSVDVVYLDPMFPPRRKAARQRKTMWLLHRLVGTDIDADALLPLARQAARRRVVVKRPLHAAPLAGEPPATSHKGKAHRFDIYPTG